MSIHPTNPSRTLEPEPLRNLDTPYPKDLRPIGPAPPLAQQVPALSTSGLIPPPSPLFDTDTSLISGEFTPVDKEQQCRGADTPYPEDDLVSHRSGSLAFQADDEIGADPVAQPIATSAPGTPPELSPAASPLPRSEASSILGASDLSGLSSGGLSGSELTRMIDGLRIEKLRRASGSYGSGEYPWTCAYARKQSHFCWRSSDLTLIRFEHPLRSLC